MEFLHAIVGCLVYFRAAVKRVPANSGRNFFHPSAPLPKGQVTRTLKGFYMASQICGGGDRGEEPAGSRRYEMGTGVRASFCSAGVSPSTEPCEQQVKGGIRTAAIPALRNDGKLLVCPSLDSKCGTLAGLLQSR